MLVFASTVNHKPKAQSKATSLSLTKHIFVTKLAHTMDIFADAWQDTTTGRLLRVLRGSS
jgi:hypothetical protein